MLLWILTFAVCLWLTLLLCRAADFCLFSCNLCRVHKPVWTAIKATGEFADHFLSAPVLGGVNIGQCWIFVALLLEIHERRKQTKTVPQLEQCTKVVRTYDDLAHKLSKLWFGSNNLLIFYLFFPNIKSTAFNIMNSCQCPARMSWKQWAQITSAECCKPSARPTNCNTFRTTITCRG